LVFKRFNEFEFYVSDEFHPLKISRYPGFQQAVTYHGKFKYFPGGEKMVLHDRQEFTDEMTYILDAAYPTGMKLP
jgi:hypothetical protein